MAFLGNPEYMVEFSPVDYAKFAEACGGKGFSVSEPSETRSIIQSALRERGPVMVEAYVDPYEPPMPPKVERDMIRHMAESLAKRQPYASRIALTLFRNRVHEALRKGQSHTDSKGA